MRGASLAQPNILFVFLIFSFLNHYHVGPFGPKLFFNKFLGRASLAQPNFSLEFSIFLNSGKAKGRRFGEHCSSSPTSSRERFDPVGVNGSGSTDFRPVFFSPNFRLLLLFAVGPFGPKLFFCKKHSCVGPLWPNQTIYLSF